MEVEIKRDGKVYQQSYKRGDPQAPLKEVGKSKERGTRVTFKPDGTIFEVTEFSFDTLSQRLRELAFLNRGVKIAIEDERTQKKHEFFYKGGLMSFVEHLNRAKTAVHPKVVHFEGEKEASRSKSPCNGTMATRKMFSPSPITSTPLRAAPIDRIRSALTRTIDNYAINSGQQKKTTRTFRVKMFVKG